MKLTDFKYDSEKAKVPQQGAEPRDSAKLMVVKRATGEIIHDKFVNLGTYVLQGDCIVYNDTKVFPARLRGKKEKTEASVEVFLLRELQPENMLWDVLVEPARKIRIGNKLYFGDELVAEVVDNTTSKRRTIRFLFDGPNNELYDILDRIGEMPLPPYIKRKPEEEDKKRYQSIFARERGAVAAPTATLHFTEQLVGTLEGQGVEMVPVTLHIGWGTYRAVEVEDLTKHRMDSENYNISELSCEVINSVRQNRKQKVVVCGSSTVRALETSITANGLLKPSTGWTDKFIYPPYDFKVTQAILTNFHQPESTLMMMSAAFCGYDLMMKAYHEAIAKKYRFFAFGDALLIL